MNRSNETEETRAIALAEQLTKEEKDFKQQQKVYLGQEYIKQLKEKEMMANVEKEKVIFSTLLIISIYNCSV